MRKLATFAAVAGFLLFAIVMLTRPADAVRSTSVAQLPITTQLAFGSITATTGPTGYNAVMTTTRECLSLALENTTNVALQATLNGQRFKTVPAGTFRPTLTSDETRLPYGTIVGVFATSGSLPTSGVFEVLCE